MLEFKWNLYFKINNWKQKLCSNILKKIEKWSKVNQTLLIKELENCINNTKTKLILLEKNRLLIKKYPYNLNINYLDYMDENWLSSEVKKIILDFRNKLWLKDTNIKDKDIFFNWFKFLLKLFAEIESDWKNIKNNNWSSAKWYFQYLISNWTKWYEIMINLNYHEVSKKEYFSLKSSNDKIYKWNKITKFNIRHKKSSYELAIYKAKKYYWENLPDWLKLDIKSPQDLNQEQQTILFLIDLFTKTKKVRDINGNLKWIKDFLPIAIKRYEWWIKKIYYIFHHTNPDESTKKRFLKVMNRKRNKLEVLK